MPSDPATVVLGTPPCFGGRPRFATVGCCCGEVIVSVSAADCAGNCRIGNGGKIMGVTDLPLESEKYGGGVSEL